MTHPHRRRGAAWKRQTAIAARWLHIYLSMVSFAILFFFAVTGITLNHAEWFSGQVRTKQMKGRVNRQWVQPKDVARTELAEYLRKTYSIKSALSDFRVDDSQISLSYKGPGYTADAFVERETGAYELTETRQGLAAVLNDLHKGRDTGTAWSSIIDVSAVLMTLVSITGLILIFFLQKRRLSGLIAVGIGALLCWVVYAIWVP